ncbi:MAG: RodZ domain-containing protein [Burkholderiales bacterium]
MSETGNQVVTETAPAPGAALAAARTAQNLSVADAARQLKLSVSQIEALEAGAFDRLPGPVFVRGFIRNYARLLNIDAEAMLRSVEPVLPQPAGGETAPPSQDIPFPPAQTRRWPWYAAGLLLLMGGLAVYEFYLNEPEFTRLKPVPAPQAAMPVPAAPIVAAPSGAATEAGPQASPALPPVSGDEARAWSQGAAVDAARGLQTGAIAGSNKIAAADVPPLAPAAAAEPERLPKAGERTLHFVFNEDSWVEIRDGSGKIIFSQLNQSGSRRRVHGSPPLSVVVGNAHGVRLTYDGQPVDLERHTKVDVARFTLE